jgi:glycosyltransferase involved in cell wall biosynthesis
MNPGLEIILPLRNPGKALAESTASLVAQTDRQFCVLLSDNFSSAGLNHIEEAMKKLATAGIAVRLLKPPFELKQIEHWNWAHSRAQADWLKPLPVGGQLKPVYVERLRQRIGQQPKAQLVRCESELAPGASASTATKGPMSQASVSPAEFLDYFPAQMRWLDGCLSMAYGRTAWMSMGGYSPQIARYAELNLNIILALHHGLENIAEPLVIPGPAAEFTLNGRDGGRVNHWLELWLVLRQARNYCLAGKLPWSKKWLLPRALAASLGRQ